MYFRIINSNEIQIPTVKEYVHLLVVNDKEKNLDMQISIHL